MNANLYIHTQSRLCTLRSCLSQSQRPTTHRNQQRTSFRLKPARNEKHPSLLQSGRQKPNRCGTANHQPNMVRTLLPQNLQRKNPNRRQRNRQPIQNLHCKSHKRNQGAMVLQRLRRQRRHRHVSIRAME